MSSTIKFEYIFKFTESKSHTYTIELDEDLKFINASPKESSWTELDNNKCTNCPLNSSQTKHCPVATNIYDLIETFKTMMSYETLEITVVTQERTYSKKTDMQDGMFSILGLIMATSGCPHLDFLRPMAKYHLPFSTSEETIIRSISLYLLGQYFNVSKGYEFDTDLDVLNDQYNQLNQVNNGILSRIRAEKDNTGDADKNAITILQTLAQLLSMAIDKDLSSYENNFKFALKGEKLD